MIAKCGGYKAWHWAHRRKAGCDPWWENETDWHRHWKNCFPTEWQEVIHRDSSSGERHIADVKTDAGVVVEFQSSSIRPEEVRARERFYDELVWVVNGNRRDRLDAGTFQASFDTGYRVINPSMLEVEFTWYGTSKIFARWSNAGAPVYIDFGSDTLWRLLQHSPEDGKTRMLPVDKGDFIGEYGGSGV